MKKLIATICCFAMLGVTAAPLTFAESEVDILLRKFVERGVITKDLAKEIKSEIKQEVKQTASGATIPADFEEKVTALLPSWINSIKLKGDLRLRYQYEKKDSGTNSRNRGRIRYRLGVISKVGDSIEIGAGLASGSTDPRSTNQTLQDSFETPNINLDYAYAKYQAAPWLALIGGKFHRKEFLWAPTDMIWDGDINPEGASFAATHEFSDNTSGFLNGGVWILDENGASKQTDPFMHYIQAGLNQKISAAKVKVALIQYGFAGVKGQALDYCAGTNSGVSSSSNSCSGVLTHDYDSIGASMEVAFKKPFDLPLNFLSFFSDFIYNYSDNVDKDTGYALGLKLGDKSVKEKGQWQLKYQFVQLEADAFPDAFPDSDRFGGATDVKGHEVSLEYALNKNVILGLDYYHTKRLDNSSDFEDLVQMDLLFKF